MGGKHNQGKTMKCLHCSKKEYMPPYRIANYKFCSRSCAYQYKSIHETVEKNCLICNSLFHVIKNRSTTAKYCSSKCYHKSMIGRGKTKYNCFHCHIDFFAPKTTNRKYCSRNCVNKASKEIFNPVFSTFRKMMLSRNMIIQCNRCGFDKIKEILGVHHIDRNRKNNDLTNLEVLCPNCHSIEHLKHTPHGFKE